MEIVEDQPPARQEGETPDTIISAIDCLRQIVELSNINEATRRIIKEVGSRLLPCIGMERELSAKQAEVERLTELVEYAKMHGLVVGKLVTTDRPEGYLAHDYRKGSTLDRIFKEWSDSIGLKSELESLKAAHATLVDQVQSHLNQFAWLDGTEGWSESCQALRASSFLPTPPVERSGE